MRRSTSNLRRHEGIRVVAWVAILTALGAFPVFLVGAMAVLIRRDLQFNEVQLGICVGAFFAAAAVGSIPAGRFVEELRGRSPLVLAGVVTAVALLGAATSQSWQNLAGWLLLGGLGNALTQVAANLVLANAIPAARQGFAFGFKQSAIPAATMLAGLAVPTIGIALGWRWVLVVSAGATGMAAMLAPPVATPRPISDKFRKPPVRNPVRPLVILAAAGGLASAAAVNLGTFFVEFAVTRGVSIRAAALVLAFGSLVGLAARVSAGWLADRRKGNHLLVVAVMIAVGAVGFLMLGLSTGGTGRLAIVFALAYGAGWGWSGLFHLSVVNYQPNAPAAATGVSQSGVFIGVAVGPLLFGLAVEYFSYSTAWLLSSGGLIAASALVLWGRTASATVGGDLEESHRPA